MNGATSNYLETLLQYYEEEISGEVYFRSLARRFGNGDAGRKLMLLADVEKYAASVIRPLIDKYDLTPRSDEELATIGEQDAERHKGYDWENYIAYMNNRFPAYIDEFNALEEISPNEDKCKLRMLTTHEIVTIEFSQLEADGDENSIRPLVDYLNGV